MAYFISNVRNWPRTVFCYHQGIFVSSIYPVSSVYGRRKSHRGCTIFVGWWMNWSLLIKAPIIQCECSMEHSSRGVEKILYTAINKDKDVITKTRLYNFDPLKPHFYIVKLGFTGVYIIFLISVQNIDCVCSLEPPRRGGSNEYPQSIFWAEIWKISGFFIWKFSIFIMVKFFNIFE